MGGILKKRFDFDIDKSINKRPNNNIKAIIVPHAGLSHSGETALRVYEQVEWEQVNIVIIQDRKKKK